MDQARRSDDAFIPLFHKHAYKLKVLKPQHQLALLGVVLLLHNVVGHPSAHGYRPGYEQQEIRLKDNLGSHLFAASAGGPRLGTDVVDADDPVEGLHYVLWIGRSARTVPLADVRFIVILVFIVYFVYDHTAGAVVDCKT